MTTDTNRVLKTATCPSLSGKTTLTYEIGANGAEILARVTRSSGSGTFSKDWVALSRIHAALEKNGAKPITLATLGPLFRGLSANTAGFLLAVLKHEGLVRAREDQARAYERLDGKAFFAEVAKLTGIAKAPAPAKAKLQSTPRVKPPPGSCASKAARPCSSQRTSPNPPRSRTTSKPPSTRMDASTVSTTMRVSKAPSRPPRDTTRTCSTASWR